MMHISVIDRLKNYLTGIWLYRWYGFVAMAVLMVVGTIGIARLPDQYRATTRLYIDTQSLLKPLMKGLSVSADANDRINQVAKTIFNRPNLAKIAQQADLDLSAHSALEKELLLDRLYRDIQLKREGSSNLFIMRYEHQDPKKAKLVVQSILNLFVESTLSNTRVDTVEAQKFLDEQISTYEQQLIRAERRLADFKRLHLGSLPSEDKTYYDRLQQLLIELEQQQMKMNIAVKRRDEIQKQIDGEVPSFGLTITQDRNVRHHPLVQKLKQMEEQLALLKTRFTDNHPDVKNLQREIQEIQANVDKINASEALDGAFDNLNQNPVYQQMKINLSDANTEVAAIGATIQELQELIDKMRERVDSVIQTETDFASLNRDYLIHKQKYQELLERQEAAKLSEEMDDTQQTIRFRVIDPPYVTEEPVSPNRALLSLGLLLVSTIFGVGAAFARALFTPAAYQQFNLKSSDKLPSVLIEIPDVTFEQSSIRRFRSIWLAGICTSILYLIGFYMVLSYYLKTGFII